MPGGHEPGGHELVDMTQVVLSLGSNIDREKNIRFAVNEIARQFGDLEISPVYETQSIGFQGKPFFNLVVGYFCGDSLENIRNGMRAIESSAGRVRGRKSFDNRILDIDVLLYGDRILHSEYNIPRDEIEKYAYVLKPLSELFPEMVHPVTGISFKAMSDDFDSTGQNLKVTQFDPW